MATVLATAWTFYAPLKLHYVEAREQHRLEVELAALKSRNEDLREEVERLKTPEGVEEVARSSLGFVKDGENLYVVLDSAEETTAVPVLAEGGPSDVDTTLWQAFLDLVFGVK